MFRNCCSGFISVESEVEKRLCHLHIAVVSDEVFMSLVLGDAVEEYTPVVL